MIERAKQALEEIAAICAKHELVLLGSCISEGIYSEISIVDSSKSNEFEAARSTELTFYPQGEYVEVERIGEFKIKDRE